MGARYANNSNLELLAVLMKIYRTWKDSSRKCRSSDGMTREVMLRWGWARCVRVKEAMLVQ